MFMMMIVKFMIIVSESLRGMARATTVGKATTEEKILRTFPNIKSVT